MINNKVPILRLTSVIIAVVLCILTSEGQPSSEMRNIFTQAESYFIYEEYELANQLYLLIDEKDNMNIKYKIGVCYLNIDGEKEKSVTYLEEALKTVDIDSKPESYKETRAPFDAYFFLGKAYMINNEFEKAINTFETFSRLSRQSKLNEQMTNFSYTDQLIQACRNALEYKEHPANFFREMLWNEKDLGAITDNPAVSFDGSTIAFTERRGVENAIFFSKKINGKWQTPVDITAELNAGTDCSTCSLNKDGTELFLYKTDNYDGAIYSSAWADGKWSPITKLNKNINTKFYESHASVSSDGTRLYIASNRDGGSGGLDIYVSEKEAGGEWGPAVNLGQSINTPYNEDTPFITENDSALFFCSEGHNSMGGYDIFRSIRSASGWNSPGNLGFPVNSADNDRHYLPFSNSSNAYYSITTDYKKKSIFYLDLTRNPDDSLITDTGNQAFPDSLSADVSLSPDKADINDTQENEKSIKYPELKYYTVQVMALYNPADLSYFRDLDDMKVNYNISDRFYRYTTGQFRSKEEAFMWRGELIRKGYPDQIFVREIAEKKN